MCKKHVITCSNHQLQHAAAIHSNRHPPASPAPHVVQETRITSIRHFFVWKPWENHGETMIQWLSDYLVMFSDYLWLSDVWTPQRNSSLFEVPFLMGCSCAVLQYHCLCLEVFVFRARHAESFTDATHEQDILRHHGRLKESERKAIGEYWGMGGAILGSSYTWFRKSTSATFRNFFSLGSTLWSMKHFMLRRVQNCWDEQHIATCLCTLGRWCHKSFQSCCWSSSDVAMENPQLFNNL